MDDLTLKLLIDLHRSHVRQGPGVEAALRQAITTYPTIDSTHFFLPGESSDQSVELIH